MVKAAGGAQGTAGPVMLGAGRVTLEDFVSVCAGAPVAIDARARAAMAASAGRLAAALDSGAEVYGVTTAYGAASGQRIEPEERAAFQLSTLRSHACGTGSPLERAPARGAWLAKLASLATGLTGASPALAQRLADLLNAGLAPAVPESGSLGASGDLIPSAHAALPLVGEGHFLGPDGQVEPASVVLDRLRLGTVQLGPRDGLSLVNGTSVTTAIGAHACADGLAYLQAAARVAAAGLELTSGHADAYSNLVIEARAHPGALRAAADVRSALEGWQRPSLNGRPPHDPYAWRCLPQVHGAAYDSLRWAVEACETELRSCTDNPLCGPDGQVVSGGNFHAAPLGLPFDAVALGVREVGALSRQRVAHLAAALAEGTPGVGLTMVLTTATASLLESSAIGPATGRWLPVDDVEDHVSNATAAARQLGAVLALLWRALAAEVVAVSVLAGSRRSALFSAGGRWLTELVEECTTGPLRVDMPLAEPLGRVAATLRARATGLT